MLLTVAPLTLTFPFTLITYLFVAHTLNAPEQALGAAVLAGGVTALVGLFCVGLVKDTWVFYLLILALMRGLISHSPGRILCIYAIALIKTLGNGGGKKF